MTNPAPHCNPTNRPSASIFGRSAPLPSFDRQRVQPARGRFEPRLAFTPEVPLLHRVERARTQILGFLRGQVFAYPGLAQR